MTRKPLRLCIAAALFAPLGALALGLGPIQVRSALNEPLDAEIPVFTTHGGELENLAVGLASRDTFRQAGIDRPALLDDLEFELVEGPGGAASIRVGSRRPIREPILNFLVELEGSRARLVREFAVFLDPPGLRERGMSLPVARAAAPEAPASPRPVPRAPADSGPAVDLGPGRTYGPVASGETLWRIAERVRPPGVSVQRMLDALFKANPKAFLRADPNNLMAEVTLRVPDAREIAVLDGGPVPEGAGPDRIAAAQTAPPGPGEAAPAPVDAGPAGQVRLVSPDEAGGAAAAGPAAGEEQPDAAGAGQPEQEPAVTVGQAVAAVPAGPAIDSIYLIAVRNRGLVGLKLTGMDELQRRIAGLEGSSPEALTPQRLFPEAPSQAQPPVQPEPAVATPTPVAPPAPAATPARTVSVPPPPRTGFVDELFELLGKPLTLGLVGLLLLLLLLLLLSRRRRHRETEPEEPAQFIPVTVADEPAPRTAAPPADQPAAAPRENPLERADLLIAVGNTAEAGHVLRVALTEQPGNTALAAKLLDVHFAARDAKAFCEAAEDLHRRLDEDDPLWLHVREMGAELVPEHPLFGGAGLPATPPPEAPARPAAPPVDSMDDLGLDLDWDDLDAAQDKTGPARTVEPVPAPAGPGSGPAGANDTLPWEVADLQEFRRSRASRQPDGPVEAPEPKSEEEDFFSDALAELDWDAIPRTQAEPLPEPPPAAAPPPSPERDAFTLDFDLEDLGETVPARESPPAAGPGDEVVPETASVAEDYVETKLDLAMAYLDMEDPVGARSLLEEVAQEGSRQQRQRADELLRKLG